MLVSVPIGTGFLFLPAIQFQTLLPWGRRGKGKEVFLSVYAPQWSLPALFQIRTYLTWQAASRRRNCVAQTAGQPRCHVPAACEVPEAQATHTEIKLLLRNQDRASNSHEHNWHDESSVVSRRRYFTKLCASSVSKWQDPPSLLLRQGSLAANLRLYQLIS